MNLTAFSLLANDNTEVDGSQEMELMIRSLSIYVGPYIITEVIPGGAYRL
jgi:hypothetical protein